ncbi:MAG: lipoprotein LpqH [Mycobacteriaceae bacterium]|nr:lipoprotein LpqH [Mycobacteriaceae bacterium]
MKRSVTIAAASMAIAAVALSGCSSNSSKKSAPSGSGETPSSEGTAHASKVVIDGKDQNIQGTTVCTTVAGTVNIAIGAATTGIGAVLTDGNPPVVKSVGLGNVNGVTLGYTAGVGQGNASVTKSGNTYTITGKATGVDMANPMQPVTKSFEIEANCS